MGKSIINDKISFRPSGKAKTVLLQELRIRENLSPRKKIPVSEIINEALITMFKDPIEWRREQAKEHSRMREMYLSEVKALKEFEKEKKRGY